MGNEIFNQKLFESEKRKFGEALALDRDARRAKVHANNQAGAAARSAAEAALIPNDMERFFRAGQPIYRGDSKNVPANLRTTSEIIGHMFPENQGTTGKSWSTHQLVADSFAKRERFGNEPKENEQRVSFILHSAIDPSKVSFDSGHFDDDAGVTRNWSSTDWRSRHSGRTDGRPGYGKHGDLAEEEIIMKSKSQIPVTGVTVRYGSMMNYHQFEEPLRVRTSFPPTTW